MTEIEVADVQKSLTLAIIVHQKIARENVVVDNPNISINQKNPRNTYGIIIQTRPMKVPILTTVVYHELILFFFLYIKYNFNVPLYIHVNFNFL